MLKVSGRAGRQNKQKNKDTKIPHDQFGSHGLLD